MQSPDKPDEDLDVVLGSGQRLFTYAKPLGCG
jgi:hypothetical protein